MQFKYIEDSHWYITSFITIAITAAQQFYPITLEAQLISLLIFGVFIGLPHGLTDFKYLQLLAWPFHSQSTQTLNYLLGGINYIIIIISFYILWLLHPTLSLCLFLATSILHFGNQDINTYEMSKNRSLHIFTRGFAIIAIPYGNFPETSKYFNAITNSNFFEHSIIPANMAYLLCILSAALLYNDKKHRFIFETFIFCILFTFVPPILAFTVYFCGWHSFRHYLEISKKFYLRDSHLPLLICKFTIISMIVVIIILLILLNFINIDLIYYENTIILNFFIPLLALNMAHTILLTVLQAREHNLNGK
ncbi:MAG: blh [Rickettsiaceae bacterium]|jgi:Brp/Blh family beta-carotene 15,15'-monooxygenase|nr:blh [Rickettsiaceae bacterium]